MADATVADRVRVHHDSLTRAERQLADSLLSNYPVSALGSITDIAAAARVSTPTVTRMVQKLGFTGFPDLQAAVRRELDEKISGPITKRNRWAGGAPETHVMNRFTEVATGNIRQTLSNIEPQTLDAACAILGDPARSVFVVGGRITRTLADYLFLHLQMIREGVTHITSSPNAWPHYLLDMNAGDVVVIFDVRRYENSTLRLAEAARERGTKIILFTDQWESPVGTVADFTFRSQIAVPSAWDSVIAITLLIEIMIAEIQEIDWPKTRARSEELEGLFDRTKFFRKI